jgi:hypothetical protein
MNDPPTRSTTSASGVTPQGSGAFCSAAAHTWTANERAALFVGSYVFDESACARVTVTPTAGSPIAKPPPGGEEAGGTYAFRC